jgi:protein farnesyltransferase/geranylgeranyltransferase type-1 subunit alpha
MSEISWEDYADLTPIPCQQRPDLPLMVQYTESYDRLMSTFRALLDKMELSERALNIARAVCQKMHSNATAWWYLEKNLEARDFDLSLEMEFLDEQIMESLKPYQLWNHRRWLVRRYVTVYDETTFFQTVIDEDQWNFHAWSYYVWYADTFNQWTWLAEMTAWCILRFPSSNSGWSARFQVVKKGCLVVSEEIELALNALRNSPGRMSECICSYLWGLIGLGCPDEDLQKVEDVAHSILEEGFVSVPVCALLARMSLKSGNSDSFNEIVNKLIIIDTPRAQFWKQVKDNEAI